MAPKMNVLSLVCGYFVAAALIESSVALSTAGACFSRPSALLTISSEVCHGVPHAAPG